MAAHHRAVNGLAAAELRRPHRALTGAAGTLLPVRLLGGAADLRDALGLVRAGTPLGELPVPDPGEDVAARIPAEDRLVEIVLAGLLRLEVGDLPDLKGTRLYSSPSSASRMPSSDWT